MSHVSVLLKEVIARLDPQSNQNFIDGTLGDGGHAEAILARTGPEGRLLGIDADKGSIARAKARLEKYGDRTVFVHGNFRNLKTIVAEKKFWPVHGILLDLGWSRSQFEESGRGFSFLKDEPLDMRFDPARTDMSAEDIVNTWPEEELIMIFRMHGEEPRAKEIAYAIARARQKKRIHSTQELIEIIARVKRRSGKIHPATQVFQALRIAVNEEMAALKEVLPQATETVETRGRIAVISFHSLEDRIVKKFFSLHPRLQAVTKKPVAPSREEIMKNPRARSAKLRVAMVSS